MTSVIMEWLLLKESFFKDRVSFGALHWNREASYLCYAWGRAR